MFARLGKIMIRTRIFWNSNWILIPSEIELISRTPEVEGSEPEKRRTTSKLVGVTKTKQAIDSLAAAMLMLPSFHRYREAVKVLIYQRQCGRQI